MIPSSDQPANFVRDRIVGFANDPNPAVALEWRSETGQRASLDYAMLLERTAKFAGKLSALGVGKGDRVLIMLSRDLEWWECMLACVWLGAVACPATTQLTPRDIAYRLKAARIQAVVASVGLCDVIDRADGSGDLPRIAIGGSSAGWACPQLIESSGRPAFAETTGADPILGYFTSGTTGSPKLALHGAAYPFAHQITASGWLQLGRGDTIWNLSDTGWAKAAWSTLFAPLGVGATIFAMKSAQFDPSETLAVLRSEPITHFCAPPTAYRMLLPLLSDGSRLSVKHCFSAGEPLNPEVIGSWEQRTGKTIFDGYGQTETIALTYNSEQEQRVGSMGKAPKQLKLCVIDDAENIVPDMTEGDVALSLENGEAPGLFLGYDNDEVRTCQVKNENWYRTGDRAYRDGAGFFWFVGRNDDIILSAGYRIGPFEVESSLIEHPAVLESAVVASPDAARGEIVKAFVVLANGYRPSSTLVKELQEHVKSSTAPYKYPRAIEFVDELPKTVSGKILRRVLKEREFSRLET